MYKTVVLRCICDKLSPKTLGHQRKKGELSHVIKQAYFIFLKVQNTVYKRIW